MSDIRFASVPPDGGLRVLADWQSIHNQIIPTDPLSVEQIVDRARRNRLFVAYHDDAPVGCSTVRPPVDDPEVATVIVRVLAGHRRRGFGAQMYAQAVAAAHDLGARIIDTVVLASNEDGLRFAARHGFTEQDRYVLDGHTIPFVDLRRPRADGVA